MQASVIMRINGMFEGWQEFCIQVQVTEDMGCYGLGGNLGDIPDRDYPDA